MKTAITQMLGMEFPLLAFSHCRDVVVEVTNAGGFGVLGGSSFTPETLEEELSWIDSHVNSRPYGVDIIVAQKLVGKGQHLTSDQLKAMIPDPTKQFVADLMTAHGMQTAVGDVVREEFAIPDAEAGQALLDVAFRHPVKFIAQALGVPPQFMIDRAHAEGVPIGALVGAREHAVKQVAAGVDVLIAQGTEAGGHCGEISTMVLVPEVIEAIGGMVPVLAAGGIVTGRQMAAAIALGAAGAWTGSVWLTTPEAETAEYTKQKMLAATSRDTRRSAGRTGKPSRQLKSDWTEAWATEGAPEPLGMPLQSMISEPALRRADVLAAQGNEGAQQLASYWVGQGVGLMNRSRSCRQTVLDFMEDYVVAVDRINESIED
ncbi:MAG: nitronate monooxygenase [Propionibacteriaceae bacterium]|nr:nitronate monooxygenase [Propionibacteriaceae bacterium]